jgi:hypothetical protein
MGNSYRDRDKRAILSAVSDLERRQGELIALADYYADEFARFLAYGCDADEDFEDFYREIKAEIPLLERLEANFSARIFKGLWKYLRERGVNEGIKCFFSTEELTENRVTYVKNPIADEAYRIFSTVLDAPTVTYAQSFVSACEDVYYGRVPFCILPYENTEQGTLTGFMRLTGKYELYPHFICSCRGESGVTKLALYGREPCVRTEGKYKMMVRTSFYGDNGQVLSDVILAAMSLGLTLIKTESEAVPWDDGRYGQIITFGANEESVMPFLTYLALEVPECSDKAVFYEVGGR